MKRFNEFYEQIFPYLTRDTVASERRAVCRRIKNVDSKSFKKGRRYTCGIGERVNDRSGSSFLVRRDSRNDLQKHNGLSCDRSSDFEDELTNFSCTYKRFCRLFLSPCLSLSISISLYSSKRVFEIVQIYFHVYSPFSSERNSNEIEAKKKVHPYGDKFNDSR